MAAFFTRTNVARWEVVVQRWDSWVFVGLSVLQRVGAAAEPRLTTGRALAVLTGSASATISNLQS
jgi:hypothetical protein